MARKPRTPETVEALKHEEATRTNIPTAEYRSVMEKEQQDPVRVAYERRNRDLDPQVTLLRSSSMICGFRRVGEWQSGRRPMPPLRFRTGYRTIPSACLTPP